MARVARELWLRTANATQQTEGLRLRRGAGPRQAKPQAVQKYDKAKQRRIKGGVSGSKEAGHSGYVNQAMVFQTLHWRLIIEAIGTRALQNKELHVINIYRHGALLIQKIYSGLLCRHSRGDMPKFS